MSSYTITVSPGHPDFLDLPWERSVVAWQSPRLIERPKGISRHQVRFVEYDQGIYVIKELPTRAARRDYEVLSALERTDKLAVTPVGLVEHRNPDANAESSAALITEYLEHSFSYRELLEGAGFGARRNQMLDAFAGLLVELHVAGCFWGDCSLSNVLYRFDAQAVDTIMVDAETAYLRDSLSQGQREEDLHIMITNVAGGMADIAASHGVALDEADLWLGEDIAQRYRSLWAEISRVAVIGPDERYKITERIERLNELGFHVQSIDLLPTPGGDRLQVKVKPGSRNYHANELKALTGIEASEWQARQMLSELYYFQAKANAVTRSEQALAAVRWRVDEVEPLLEHLRAIDGVADPLQRYCDLLHHRYMKSVEAGFDIGTQAALADWLQNGCPGYRV